MRAAQVSLHTHKHITKQLLLKLLTAGFSGKKKSLLFKQKCPSEEAFFLFCETELSITDPVLKKGTSSGNLARKEKNLTTKC